MSVIVPTCDRPDLLRACLGSLSRLDYPKGRYEVIVVDDGSRAPCAEVVAPFGSELEVTLLRQAREGPAGARNAGARRARGDYLAFLDDDCQAAEGWLRELAAQLSRTPDHMVGGRTVNAVAGSPYPEASQLLLSYLYAYQASNPDEDRFFASCNLAVPADAFRSLGGFSARFPLAAGEDRDLCYRWLRRGCELSYAPGAVVYHGHAMKLGGFCRQHFSYGRGAFFYHRARQERDGGPLRVKPPSFYVNMLRHPLRSAGAWDPRAWLHVALIALSQVANAAGFAWERLSSLLPRRPARPQETLVPPDGGNGGERSPDPRPSVTAPPATRR